LKLNEKNKINIEWLKYIDIKKIDNIRVKKIKIKIKISHKTMSKIFV
jgi:hypothetical protein